MNKPLIVLAPLAGYTNVAYRTMMKSFGVDLVVSEMISDFALIYHNQETIKMTETALEEHPIAIQLFGGSKEPLVQGLKILQTISDYDYLDINLGCPVHKVTKNNAGSAWLKKERQEELYEMMASLVQESQKPVTCKVRLGWDNVEDCVTICKILEKAGVSLIVVHGRTRSQLYAGKANYECIKKIKEEVHIPIIANGDITTLDKAIQVLNETHCDGIAIGRGCLGNPHLIRQIKHYYETGERIPEATISMQLSYLKEHFERLKELKGEHTAIQEIRGIASWYLKHFSHVKEYKVRFTSIKSSDDFYKIIDEISLNPLIQRETS